jgi:hypothetical protein
MIQGWLKYRELDHVMKLCSLRQMSNVYTARSGATPRRASLVFFERGVN